MTSYKKNQISFIINIIILTYAVSIAYAIIKKHFFSLIPYDDCGLTDYLVNYQGGFVRRGILGEIVFHISNHIDINLQYTFSFISIASLILLLVYLIKKFRENQLCWWILPLNICLSGAFFLRKDYLCMCLIGAALYTFSHMASYRLRVITINLILCFALCLHESVFFIIIPLISCMLLFDERTKHTKWLYKIASILPMSIMFMLLAHFKGNEQIAVAIHNSWNIPEMGNLPTGTIKSLGNTTNDFIQFHLKTNFLSPSYHFYGWFTKPLLWCLCFILLPNILFSRHNLQDYSSRIQIRNFTLIFLFQFLSLLPMLTILSCDQSRIFYYWTVSSILVYITVPQNCLSSIFPQKSKFLAERINTFTLIPWCRKFSFLLLFLICVTPVGTDIYSASRHSIIGRLTLETYVRISQLMQFIEKHTTM